MAFDGQHADCAKAQQPTAADNDVSDSDPSRVFQPHVGDGVDDGQVALCAGEDLKQELPCELNGWDTDARHRQIRMLSVDTTADEDEGWYTDQLHKNRLVGEEVGMASGCAGAMPPPSFETQKQDVDVNWDEEEDVCDG